MRKVKVCGLTDPENIMSVAAAGAEHKTQLHAGWLLSLHGCTYVCKIVRKVVLSFSTSLHTHIRRTSTYSK